MPSPGPGPLPAPATEQVSNRGLWVAVGIAVVGLLLVSGLVLNGQSQRNRSISAASAPTSTRTTSAPTTTVDPKILLGQQFLAITNAAADATTAYDSSCGCPNHFNLKNALAALPAFVAAKQVEATQLDALTVGAPPLIASHLETMSHLETQVVRLADQLLAYATGMPEAAAVAGFQGFDIARAQALDMALTIRADLGVIDGHTPAPVTSQTI
jgi:hypothetical protein